MIEQRYILWAFTSGIEHHLDGLSFFNQYIHAELVEAYQAGWDFVLSHDVDDCLKAIEQLHPRYIPQTLVEETQHQIRREIAAGLKSGFVPNGSKP